MLKSKKFRAWAAKTIQLYIMPITMPIVRIINFAFISLHGYNLSSSVYVTDSKGADFYESNSFS